MISVAERLRECLCFGTGGRGLSGTCELSDTDNVLRGAVWGMIGSSNFREDPSAPRCDDRGEVSALGRSLGEGSGEGGAFPIGLCASGPDMEPATLWRVNAAYFSINLYVL